MGHHLISHRDMMTKSIAETRWTNVNNWHQLAHHASPSHFYSSIVAVQESGSHVHPISLRLGSTGSSEKASSNAARDFLRAAGVAKDFDA